jgi:HEAT repeat protein
LASYPQRPQPAARGWLHSENEWVRLVAVDALTRARDAQALPDLLGALDDPFLLNRQFAMRELRERFGVQTSDFGYRFYMTSEERKKPMEEIRARWAREQ